MRSNECHICGREIDSPTIGTPCGCAGELVVLRARVEALEAALDGLTNRTPLMADVMGERDALRTRVTELEVLIDQKERCQCSDSEACAFVRRIAELEAVLARVRCCEAACCPQCAAEIAALNIQEEP